MNELSYFSRLQIGLLFSKCKTVAFNSFQVRDFVSPPKPFPPPPQKKRVRSATLIITYTASSLQQVKTSEIIYVNVTHLGPLVVGLEEEEEDGDKSNHVDVDEDDVVGVVFRCQKAPLA